jgi:ubiquinone/menaquinone biosynthesis C-methylase UbiE
MERPAVAVTLAHDTRQAFDSVAAEYHRSNAENPLLSAMRQRTIAAVRHHVPAGSRILDLGCGPGTDAETLARHGYWVVAIDGAPRMVDEARRRIAAAGVVDRVAVHHLGIEELDALPTDWVDAVYSDFGPLNCVADLDGAARLIARRLRTDGLLVASVIGRVCPWEIALYTVRGDHRRARIRFSRERVPVPLNGHTVWTRYYTPREFVRAFHAAGFRQISVQALALFAPPPFMQAFAERHPALVHRLQQIDAAAGGWPLLRQAGDHFLIVLRKCGADA